MTPRRQEDSGFLNTSNHKILIAINIVLLVVYTVVIATWFEIGALPLFILLILSQIFYFWQGLTHMFTVWDTSYLHKPKRSRLHPEVDVFIPVAGEPLEVIRETVSAAARMRYKNFNVYILNDSFVAGHENWQNVEVLADELGVACITRTVAGGAKAGNINNALGQTTAPFVAILDADHVPKRDFLKKLMRHAADPSVGFIQSPQYYKNAAQNEVTQGAWDQQQFFFGAICRGKNRMGVVTMCGTNMVIRRKPLEEVGGMCDFNIAEDFITGMFIHELGYKSVYVPEILATGLAPEDYSSYFKQQLRWARGSLEVLIRYNPLTRRGLSSIQKIQYLASASFYLTGLFVLINALLPLIFLYTGLVPLTNPTMVLVIAFLPYMFVTLMSLQLVSNHTYTLKALAFSMGSFWIHIIAFSEVLLGKKRGFSVTSKQQLEGFFLPLVIPHLIYFALVFVGFFYALATIGISTSLLTNISWALFFVVIFVPSLQAAGAAKMVYALTPRKVVGFLKKKFVSV